MGKGQVVIKADAPKGGRIPFYSIQAFGSGHWSVRGIAEERSGRLVVTELTIIAPGAETLEQLRKVGYPPVEEAITARHLRQISPREIVEFVLPYLEHATRHKLSKEAREILRRLAATQQGQARPKDDYAEVALEYLDALQRAPDRPVAWIEEQRAKAGWTHPRGRAWIRDQVRLSRKYGFLTPGQRGYAGANATDKLKSWARSKKRAIPGTGRGRKK